MGYRRKYHLFSACGLNCGLCPRFYTDGDSKCPGCGGEGFTQIHCSCSVLSCNQRKGLEFCYLCNEFPCKKYNKWEKDSFITHKNMMKDFEKVRNNGLKVYQNELNEKIEILNNLLDNYNDGRRKSFFCLAVNLLELDDIKIVMKQLKNETNSKELNIKEKALIARKLFETMAEERKIVLKLDK
ncbi:MAG: DUF3795 domain-containing protein [Lachnospiraceae bacterium]|jgi:hypothetical protein|nr:DUF3795 domain-containing protein [Lachnospiraceae bacterium]